MTDVHPATTDHDENDTTANTVSPVDKKIIEVNKGDGGGSTGASASLPSHRIQGFFKLSIEVQVQTLQPDQFAHAFAYAFREKYMGGSQQAYFAWSRQPLDGGDASGPALWKICITVDVQQLPDTISVETRSLLFVELPDMLTSTNPRGVYDRHDFAPLVTEQKQPSRTAVWDTEQQRVLIRQQAMQMKVLIGEQQTQQHWIHEEKKRLVMENQRLKTWHHDLEKKETELLKRRASTGDALEHFVKWEKQLEAQEKEIDDQSKKKVSQENHLRKLLMEKEKSFRQTIKDLKANQGRAQVAHAKQKNKLLSESRATVQIANQKVAVVRKELDAKKAELDRLKAENTKIKAENTKIKAENTKIKAENSTLEAENAETKTTLDQVEAANATLVRENQSLVKECQQLRAERTTLHNKSKGKELEAILVELEKATSQLKWVQEERKRLTRQNTRIHAIWVELIMRVETLSLTHVLQWESDSMPDQVVDEAGSLAARLTSLGIMPNSTPDSNQSPTSGRNKKKRKKKKKRGGSPKSKKMNPRAIAVQAVLDLCTASSSTPNTKERLVDAIVEFELSIRADAVTEFAAHAMSEREPTSSPSTSSLKQSRRYKRETIEEYKRQRMRVIQQTFLSSRVELTDCTLDIILKDWQKAMRLMILLANKLGITEPLTNLTGQIEKLVQSFWKTRHNLFASLLTAASMAQYRIDDDVQKTTGEIRMFLEREISRLSPQRMIKTVGWGHNSTHEEAIGKLTFRQVSEELETAIGNEFPEHQIILTITKGEITNLTLPEAVALAGTKLKPLFESFHKHVWELHQRDMKRNAFFMKYRNTLTPAFGIKTEEHKEEKSTTSEDDEILEQVCGLFEDEGEEEESTQEDADNEEDEEATVEEEVSDNGSEDTDHKKMQVPATDSDASTDSTADIDADIDDTSPGEGKEKDRELVCYDMSTGKRQTPSLSTVAVAALGGVDAVQTRAATLQKDGHDALNIRRIKFGKKGKPMEEFTIDDLVGLHPRAGATRAEKSAARKKRKQFKKKAQRCELLTGKNTFKEAVTFVLGALAAANPDLNID